ncbi:MAG TPA: hypothetical protein VKA13_03410, partial [Gammaproteobacteria bacterium]|nr:hypothetical protein [Gammaproteobacteria bacterium]
AAASSGTLFGPTIRGVVNQQSVSLGRMHQNYREYNDGLSPGLGEILDREDGNVGQFDYRFAATSGRALGNFDFQYSSGDTFYDGHLQNGTPHTDTTHNTIYAVRANLGYILWSGQNGLLAPQLEFGYRIWKRYIDGTGQEEKYYHGLFGAGFRGYYALSQNMTLKGLAFVGKTVAPMIEGTAVLNWDPASLGSSRYERAGLGLDYHLSGAWHVGLDIDYVTWRYKQSGLFVVSYDNGAPCCYAREPRSRTSQTSYLLTIGHEF